MRHSSAGLASIVCVLAVSIDSDGPMVVPACAAETGAIAGQITDERGQMNPVGKAVVFLLDARSGLPILKSTKAPFDPADRSTSFEDFWHAVTTDRGQFDFREVLPGTYRLVAQSWSGTEGMIKSDGDPSTIVILHGVAHPVEVRAGETSNAAIHPLGRGVLHILNDPEEEHAFLLISLKPRLGPGVLGPVAWGPEFLSGLIGYTRMEQAHVTLVGLPEGAQIHVGLFNYDNNPGVGGDTYTVGEQTEVRLEIFATWSNGKSEPTSELLPLTDYLDANDVTAERVFGLTGSNDENQAELLRLLRNEPDRRVQVGDLGEFRVADILAASTHRDLREFHRERREKQNK